MSYPGTLDECRKDIKRTNPYTETIGETSPVLNGSMDGGGMAEGGLKGMTLSRPRGLKIKQSEGSKNMRRSYGVDG